MRIDVYRNLHKDCYSVRSREPESYGKVIAHMETVYVRDATFVVQPAGQRRARETGIRNVHAFVRGNLTTEKDYAEVRKRPRNLHWLYYNPHKCDTFLLRAGTDSWPAISAEMVWLEKGRNIVLNARK